MVYVVLELSVSIVVVVIGRLCVIRMESSCGLIMRNVLSLTNVLPFLVASISAMVGGTLENTGTLTGAF